MEGGSDLVSAPARIIVRLKLRTFSLGHGLWVSLFGFEELIDICRTDELRDALALNNWK